MVRFATLILLLTVSVLSDSTAKIDASPLPPNVAASTSTNGRFLVVSERQYDNPNPHVVRRILRTTYHVMEMEAFLNGKDRLSIPARFWSESWEVTLDGVGGFWPLISNDGESLVLVGVTVADPRATALTIYRKALPEGTLIRVFRSRTYGPPGSWIPTARGDLCSRTLLRSGLPEAPWRSLRMIACCSIPPNGGIA
jgi:hypothetical protein